MTHRNLAKVTTYLSDRRYREANSRIRAEVLGDHRPAITIIIGSSSTAECFATHAKPKTTALSSHGANPGRCR